MHQFQLKRYNKYYILQYLPLYEVMQIYFIKLVFGTIFYNCQKDNIIILISIDHRSITYDQY